jgi:hypothetical protein
MLEGSATPTAKFIPVTAAHVSTDTTTLYALLEKLLSYPPIAYNVVVELHGLDAGVDTGVVHPLIKEVVSVVKTVFCHFVVFVLGPPTI